MDPNANLEEQLRLAGRMLTDGPHDQDALRLCELVEALNEWIERGGFLPARWTREGR